MREIGLTGQPGMSPKPHAARFREHAMQKETERDRAINELREKLPQGTVIYTIRRHISATGLTHWLDLYHVSDNIPLRITWTVARAIAASYSDNHEALKTSGGGMDAGRAIVYYLSHVLHGSEYALKQQWL